ncbi:MAG TPA: transposase [Anaerolineaceae bacterium]|nr:transposase [Anaerolineaceae bacterium]
MYRKNPRSPQPVPLSDVHQLPKRSLQRLQGSWAATFREEVFLRIDEDQFAPLYSDKPSRPNVPVNLLVGLDILKEGHHWTDEELYEHFLFNLQVRYALGCDQFGGDEFDLRTLYYFRQRLIAYTLRTGHNLLVGLFEQITDEQMAQLGLKTDKQRFDSTMLLSNIADLSRLELLIQVLQRVWRILRPADQERYAALLQPYNQESAGQYTYQLKGREVVWAHIGLVGRVLHQLLDELGAGYGSDPVYAVAQRFFAENFVVEESGTRAKDNSEITPGCLQSLDDLEASYRKKGNRAYKGYVANLGETCNPDNRVQLIDQVQVAPNQSSDIQLLKEGLESLKERTGMDTAVTDGGYVSPEIDQLMREQGVEQIPTALTGTLPDHKQGKLAFSDFEMELDPQGEVIRVTCPAGRVASLQTAASGKSYRLSWDAGVCRECPLFQMDRCPVKPSKDPDHLGLYVPKDRAQSAQRRRHFELHKPEARNLRTAVEASVFQLKHNWVKGKLRVRGLFRVTSVVVGSALSVNLRRIDRYRKGKLRDRRTLEARKTARAAVVPI